MVWRQRLHNGRLLLSNSATANIQYAKFAMPSVVEEIPGALQPAADAALAWINAQRGAQFRLTGLVDPDEALGRQAGEPMELGLVLCDGDLCVREQVRVLPGSDGFQVGAVDAGASEIPAHLDPPVGVRGGWLDQQLEKHAFILLLYYRGLW